MRKILFLLTSLGFLVAGVLLGLLNNQLVDFDLYFYQIQLPLAMLLGVMFFLGLAFALFFSLYQLIVLKYKLRQTNRTIAKQLAEIVELKSQKTQQQAKFDEAKIQLEAAQLPALPNSK